MHILKKQDFIKRLDDEGLELCEYMKSNAVLVAFIEDKVVGAVLTTYDKHTNTASFSHFAVPEKFGGQGIGSFLLLEMERYFKDIGARNIKMGVISDKGRSDLHKWYLKRGYSMTKEVAPFPLPDALLEGYEHVHLIYFTKQLV